MLSNQVFNSIPSIEECTLFDGNSGKASRQDLKRETRPPLHKRSCDDAGAVLSICAGLGLSLMAWHAELSFACTLRVGLLITFKLLDLSRGKRSPQLTSEAFLT